MITFVYCCVCLLIVCCQTTRIEDEDNVYTNDSPDLLPKVENFRYKLGADILIKCNSHLHQDDITWQFKRCHTNYRGIKCDKKSMYKIPGNEEWKKLEITNKRKRLEIRNATEEDEGLYRCLYNDSIIKIYIVDIVVPVKYAGPSPEVVSLLPSLNSTILPNTHLVIQCKVTSVIPPEIRWFKECNGRRCEVLENGHCYCPIPLSNSVYSASNNVYLSKLNIYNARTIDSGGYVCLVISLYGQDYKNITVRVRDEARDLQEDEEIPIIIWLCFNRRNRKKNCRNEHQKQLIKLVDVVVNVDDVV